jgi:hypothetical protein
MRHFGLIAVLALGSLQSKKAESHEQETERLKSIVAIQQAQIETLKKELAALKVSVGKDKTDLVVKINNRFNSLALAQEDTGFADQYVNREIRDGGFSHTQLSCGNIGGIIKDARLWLNPGTPEAKATLPQFDRVNCTRFSLSKGSDIN